MNTTKLCRYCKEDILSDASLCKHCGKKQPSKYAGKIWAGIIVLTLFAFIQSAISNDLDTQTAPAVDSVKTGESGRLYIQSDGPVLVAINKEYYDEMFRLITVNDTLGLAKMTLDGKILLVDRGTAVKVIGGSYTYREVRINEGKYIGQSGLVPMEMVVR